MHLPPGSARVSRVGLRVPRKRTFPDLFPHHKPVTMDEIDCGLFLKMHLRPGSTRASRVGDRALAIADFFLIFETL